MKLKEKILVIALFIIFFGGIFIADNMGFWQTESTKAPQLIKEGEFEGLPNPEDIRGSYSFLDIENAFGIEAAVVAKAFGIESSNPDEIKAKDLEEIYGDLGDEVEIGTGAIKLFVAIYKDMPFESEDYLPSTAVQILKEEGKWTDEIAALLEGHIIEFSEKFVATEVVVKESEEDHELEIKVKGGTTVSEVITWGISREEIEDIIGVEVENANMLIKDICTQNEISFSEVKDALNSQLEELGK